MIAVDDAGKQYFTSDSIRVRTDEPTMTAAPKAPRGLSAKSDASGAVTLRWEDRSTDERRFRIERSMDPSFREFAVVDKGQGMHLSYDLRPVGAGETKYVGTGGEVTARAQNQSYRLRPEQTYYYRVTAYNSYGHSVASEVVSVTIPAKVRAPAPARRVSVAAHASNSGAVVVSWTPSAAGKKGGAGGAVGGYRIERRREAGASSWCVLGTVGAGTSDFVDLALRTSNPVGYRYRVVAFNTAGDAATAEVQTLRTPDATPVSKAPAGLVATTFSDTAIKLTWEDSSTNETGFRVERSSDGVTWLIVGGVAADDETYKDEVLSPGTKYYYRVTAFNTNDMEPAAGPSSVAKGKTMPRKGAMAAK